nr:hypothetical protein [uncultured Rhodopila sp.]
MDARRVDEQPVREDSVAPAMPAAQRRCDVILSGQHKATAVLAATTLIPLLFISILPRSIAAPRCLTIATAGSAISCIHLTSMTQNCQSHGPAGIGAEPGDVADWPREADWLFAKYSARLLINHPFC